MYYSSYPNRTRCDVLEDMRKCYNTYNFAGIFWLIEELQSIGNKMESGLQDKGNVVDWGDRRRELKVEIKELERKKKDLELDIKEIEVDRPTRKWPPLTSIHTDKIENP